MTRAHKLHIQRRRMRKFGKAFVHAEVAAKQFANALNELNALLA